jgi:hypothetical protein
MTFSVEHYNVPDRPLLERSDFDTEVQTKSLQKTATELARRRFAFLWNRFHWEQLWQFGLAGRGLGVEYPYAGTPAVGNGAAAPG